MAPVERYVKVNFICNKKCLKDFSDQYSNWGFFSNETDCLGGLWNLFHWIFIRTQLDKHPGTSLDMFSLDAVQTGLVDLLELLQNLGSTIDKVQEILTEKIITNSALWLIKFCELH